MKEEWRETVEYYNRTRECVVPKTHDEIVTEEEWNDYVPGEAKKVGHKVLCGFIEIPNRKKTKRKNERRMDNVQVVGAVMRKTVDVRNVKIEKGMKIAM